MNDVPTSLFGERTDDALRRIAVLSSPSDGSDPGDRLARATWTTVAEPGDRMAGMLIATLGAAGALQRVASGAAAEYVAAELRAAGRGAMSAGDVDKALARWRPRLSADAALLALERAHRCGARLLVPDDSNWPNAVGDLDDHAPIALWFRGTDAALFAVDDSISLVGARAATGYGEHVTMEAAAGLVDRGYAIVSGAAYGIDGMAHRAALASRGTTVAFLAGGVDRFYPSGHDALLGRIAETGAVLSELPCGEPPTKWRFLQRNRLIAAASRATVVMEAGWRSGSLNTAGHAAALGRPLGAVPGPVTSAASAGCHRLIREFEAVCVTGPEDIAALVPLDSLPITVDPVPGKVSSGGRTRLGDRPSLQLRVLDALSTRSPRTSADIAARAGLAVATVQSTLGVLQLESAVVEGERGWTVR
jgi:DNA processing protein